MEYRREIDGLRAVAVIPVILFHAGFEAFKGGFVGVDVFFVISGYLITTIILTEKEQGTFSLINFYERRTRRILPALFLVMLATLPFAWLWLLPLDMVSFSQSLVAVATFSSNIFFWRTSGYWGLDNELVPLLHTWSLAVEEQYYLVFPLFLMLMWRFRRRWILSSFVVVAVASLFLAHWGAFQYPTANFFLLVTRGWELAIGASIAFYFLYRNSSGQARRVPNIVHEGLGVLGLLMIGYAVFAFDENVPFPSLYALVPTVGTGLIVLFSSSRSMTGRLLGTGPLVGIGLISYSAYLWHLPLFAFARYRSLTEPDPLLLSSLAGISMALAYLSWRFFEKPFRNKGVFSRKAIFTFAAAASIFFIGIGLSGHATGGWPGRIDRKLQASVETAEIRIPDTELCLTNSGRDRPIKNSCTLVASDDTFAYLLGDSHAIAVTYEMKNAFQQSGMGLIQATERGCPPVQDVYVYVSEADKLRCYEHNEEVFLHLEGASNVQYVILLARWALYLEGERFDNREGGVEREEILHFDVSIDNAQEHPTEPDRSAYFQQAYVNSVKKLLQTGKKLILVYPIPEVGWSVPRYIRNYYLMDSSLAFSPGTGSTSYATFRDRNKKAYTALDSIGDHPNLVRVYPEKLFCNSALHGRCVVQDDNSLLYRDDDHLSNAGAKLLIKDIMRHLN